MRYHAINQIPQLGVIDMIATDLSANLVIFAHDMINVAISDDHIIVSQSLDAMLQKCSNISIIAHAHSIAECEKMLEQNHDMDVLLLDVGMPDGNSLDYVETWKAQHANVRILILTTYAEAAMINRAFASGADGYLLKTCTGEELIEGITTVARGERYLCSGANQLLQDNPQTEVVVLTPREREVLRLIVNGYSIKMIADELCLAFETVHSYYKYLKLKLNVPNTAALVRIAMEQKLV